MIIHFTETHTYIHIQCTVMFVGSFLKKMYGTVQSFVQEFAIKIHSAVYTFVGSFILSQVCRKFQFVVCSKFPTKICSILYVGNFLQIYVTFYNL